MNPSSAPNARFAPPLPPVPQSPRSELLGRFVPLSIGRIPPIARVERPLRVALFGLATAGIVPLLFLRTRLKQYVLLQQQQWELATELAAGPMPDSSAGVLLAAARRIQTPAWLALACDAAILGAAVTFFLLWQRADFSFGAAKVLLFAPLTPPDPLRLLWIGLLTGAYLLMMLRINAHIARLQQFSLAFNAATEGRAEPIPSPRATFGLRPLNIIVSAIMLYIGALWFLPMMLAWGAYQTFVFDRDYPLRLELADRLQKLSGVSPVIDRAGICQNPQCGQSLPTGASFCPRCGRKVPA